MGNSILFSNDRYTIQQYNEIPDDAIHFLESIAWGSEGTLYQHKNTAAHFRSVKDPLLFVLRENGRVQATTLISPRIIHLAHKRITGYYFRYFAIAPALRGSGIMPRFSRLILENLKQNAKGKAVFYSYVEKNNRSSYRVTEMAGLKHMAEFITIGFSRFSPSWSKMIQQIKYGEERTEVLELLKSVYNKHSFTHFNPIFLNDNYYVLRDHSEILAGCQYHRVHWTVAQIPGLKGKIIMKLAPNLPLINRLFNPKRFEFLALEGIFFKKGQENALKKLVGGLLAKEK